MESKDKESWGGGPWDDEPDREEWIDEASGYPCCVLRGPMGALCGYVGVRADHPFFGKGYDHTIECDERASAMLERPVGTMSPIELFTASLAGEGRVRLSTLLDCHGSVTYAGKKLVDEPDEHWWFGFDCSHSGDYAPRLRSTYGSGIYRPLSYVKAECAKLAKGLHDLRGPSPQPPLNVPKE